MMATIFKQGVRPPSRYRNSCRKYVSAVTSTSDLQVVDGNDSSTLQEEFPSLGTAFPMQSRRRVQGSPVLPLEKVAMSKSVQARIESVLAAEKLTPRHIRKSAMAMDRVVARESAHERRKPKGGQPIVAAPPRYGPEEAISYTVTRSPGTLATNMYVMSEVRRCLPDYRPQSMLDFGAGIGVSVMAAARVFSGSSNQGIRSSAGEDLGMGLEETELADGIRPRLKAQREAGMETTSLNAALLVEHSQPMRSMSAAILPQDANVAPTVRLSHVASIAEAKRSPKVHDLVCASYSLSEIVRDAMANPAEHSDPDTDEDRFKRDSRVKVAEKRLKRTIKTLWSRTKPGGLFIILEDGTAGGFETLLFAREIILGMNAPFGDAEAEADSRDLKRNPGLPAGDENRKEAGVPASAVNSHARVVAPCLHSEACPLRGTITPHRVCRFQQRFNRPSFLRKARSMPTGYEDEYFSYIVLQKLSHMDEHVAGALQQSRTDVWGRIIRQPLLKGKHVVLDACTVEGALERRVVSKKSAAPGHYPRARQSKWGDVWPVKPSSKPQVVNF